MAGKIKVEGSKVSAATLGLPRSGQQSAIDTRNTGDQLAIKSVLNSAAELTETQWKAAKADHEAQLASDVLASASEYHDLTRGYEDEYMNGTELNDYQDAHKGKGARETTKDLETWHAEKEREFSERFAGADPRQQLMWKRQQSQIRQGSLNRGQSYATTEDRQYRDDTTKGRSATFLQKVGERWDSDGAVQVMARGHNAEIDALNPGKDMTAYKATVDLKVATTRIQTGIAKAKSDEDVAEVERLQESYKGVLGTSYDEVSANVRDLRVTHDAREHAEYIRDTMSDKSRGDKFDKLNELAGGDPDIIAKGRALINQSHSDEERIRREREEDVRDTYIPQINSARNVTELESVITSINATPMPSALRSELLQKAHTGVSHPGVSDRDKLVEMRGELAKGNISPSQAKRDYYGFVSQIDWDESMRINKDVNQQRVNSYLFELESVTLPKMYPNKSDKKKLITPFVKRMELWYKEQRAKPNGVTPSDKELKAQEMWLMEDVVYDYDKFTFSETVERWRLSTLDDDDFDVPPSHRFEIIRELKAKGWEPTDARIVRAYREKLQETPE